MCFSTFADIDECKGNATNCDNNANCENTDGSFNCICSTGYTGNGTSCEGQCVFETPHTAAVSFPGFSFLRKPFAGNIDITANVSILLLLKFIDSY